MDSGKIAEEIESLKSKVDILLMVVNEEVLKKRGAALLWYDEYQKYLELVEKEEDDRES